MYHDGLASSVTLPAGFRVFGIAHDKFPLSSTLEVSVESGAEHPPLISARLMINVTL
jgi:hypothetical protein